MCLYRVFYDIVEFFFLFDVSVGSYPVSRNHPAVRIKRIRLSVNLADCIVPVGVPTQQIPPASVLAHPASKILARHPAVRSLDPRIAVGKAFINWLHTLILGVALACVCTFGVVRMISEDAVTLNPRMPLLISLRSVITVLTVLVPCCSPPPRSF